MKAVHFLLMAFLAWCCPAVAAEGEASSTSANPTENLETAIPHGIQLLEAGKYKEFIETFMPPEQIKKRAEKKTLEETAQEFSKIKGPRLLAALKAIKGTKPTMEDDGNSAKFAVPGEPEQRGPKSIQFVKIDKKWYIGN